MAMEDRWRVGVGRGPNNNMSMKGPIAIARKVLQIRASILISAAKIESSKGLRLKGSSFRNVPVISHDL